MDIREKIASQREKIADLATFGQLVHDGTNAIINRIPITGDQFVLGVGGAGVLGGLGGALERYTPKAVRKFNSRIIEGVAGKIMPKGRPARFRKK